MTMESSSGCDSIISLDLSLLAPEMKSDSFEICPGDSVFIIDEWIDQAGIFVDTIDNDICGIIQSSQVFVFEEYEVRDSFVLCPNDSVLIAGEWIATSGEYEYSLNSASGCDSIYIALVDQLLLPGQPTIHVDCDNLQIEAAVEFTEGWGILWSNGDTDWTTIYNEGGLIDVAYDSGTGCHEEYEITIPELPNIEELPNFQDTLINAPDNAFPVKVNLDTSEWKIKWYPSSNVSCPDCFETTITTDEDIEIIIELTHSSGCVYTKRFFVDLQQNREIYIPNVFTPNGDGLNDLWEVFIPDGYIIKEAALFDRWGNKMKDWKNTAELSWDGSYRGQILNPGVFAYYIKYNDGLSDSIIHGDVTLVK